jgi:hypothetical protein
LITHGAGDGLLPTKSVEYYYAPAPKMIGSRPMNAGKSNGGILPSDTTTALDLTTEPITVCEGTQDTDSEWNVERRFSLVSPQVLVTATFIRLLVTVRRQLFSLLCVRFQDVAVPRSEWWCSSEEQAGMTLDGAYYSGGNQGEVCEELGRSDPKCNSWMWRKNSGNSHLLLE